MSIKNRKNAVNVIAKVLDKTRYADVSSGSIANHLLNQLIKAGFLNDKVTVTAKEIKEELKKAPFVCRVKE